MGSELVVQLLQWIKERGHRYERILGWSFVVIGLSRVIVFSSYVGFLQEIFHWFQLYKPFRGYNVSSLALVIAVSTIVIEIGVGITYIRNYRHFLLDCLLLADIGLMEFFTLLFGVHRSVTVDYSIGIVSVFLPWYLTLFLRLYLMVSIILLSFSVGDATSSLDERTVMLLLMVLLYFGFRMVRETSIIHITKDTQGKRVPSFVTQHVEALTKYHQLNVLFLIDQDDFGCPRCYNSIIDCVHAVQEIVPQTQRRAVLFWRSSRSPYEEQHVERWKRNNGITLPHCVLYDSLFTIFDVDHSTLILCDKDFKITLKEEFPLSESKMNLILTTLQKGL